MTPLGDTLQLLVTDLRNRMAADLSSDEVHLAAAMAWLVRAQVASENKGVSAGFHLLRGWAPPYPETTGYIIPTFLRYATLVSDSEFRRRALAMADWELEIQLANGAIPGRTGIAAEPIAFDTGQVIFGWIAAYRATRDSRYLSAARHAANWLLATQEADGAWRRHEFLGIAHAYNSRVSWALLVLSEESGEEVYIEAARKQLEWTLHCQGPDGWIDNMSFKTDQPAFTHTIAYTLEGIWESSFYVDAALAQRLKSAVYLAWKSLERAFFKHASLAGRMGPGWRAEGRFVCLTGNVQLAIIALQLYKASREPKYLVQADHLLASVKLCQPLGRFGDGVRGGIAGSHPHWGKYLPLWYPNWATKFYCDALMLNLGIARGDTGFWDRVAG